MAVWAIYALDHGECWAVLELNEGIGDLSARPDDMPALGTRQEVWI